MKKKNGINSKNAVLLSVFITCAFLFLSSCSQRNRNSEFYKLTTSDFSSGSYFICPIIQCNDSLYSIVIQNDDFWGMLFRRAKVESQIEFTDKILSALIDNKPFLVDTSILSGLKNGYIVERDEKLDSLLSLDKDLIFRKYFKKNTFLSETFDFTQEKRVIFALYNKRIACRRDCVSGYILVKDSKN